MQTETTTSEIIKFEEVTAVMANAGEVLTKNKALTQKALDKVIFLIDTIEGQGMSAEIDKELNDWQVNAKKALEINLARRSPITQMANMITKAYTAEEAPLDGTKKDSYYTKVQIYRNQWAKECAEKEKAETAKILLNQNIAKEKIELKSKIEQQFRSAYLNKLYDFKKYGNDKLNAMTLENFEASESKIMEIKINYPRDKFNELSVNVTSVYMDKIELASLINATRTGLYDELSNNFREEMEGLKQQLLDLIPSKKKELDAMAKAGEEKRKELQLAADKRQKDEEAELLKKQEEAQKQSAANVQLQQSMDTANSLFDTAAKLAEVKDENNAKVREGFKINVLNTAGLGAIFIFWFEKEGMNLTVEDALKKTGTQMKTFCEKFAHKNGEKIESIHLTYEEDFKAVATKEK